MNRMMDVCRRGVTVVDRDWLFSVAQGTMLCRNELRESPSPQYDAKSDSIRAFVTPHFGDRDWVRFLFLVSVCVSTA